jgi:UDPglucose 6-dehydrogenase
MDNEGVNIGFIGQGFIGKHLADDFTERGYSVVRYAMEEPYVQNKAALMQCDVVFIAVPTPTTPRGFDASVLESVLPLVKTGAIAVIKSTILPGTTKRLQEQFPDITVLHAPEFLREKQAAEDTRSPERNIIGIPIENERYRNVARQVLAMLPNAPHEVICKSEEAELIKYGGNCFLALKVVFMNTLYDVATAIGADYEVVADAMVADSRVGSSHMRVVDTSGHPGSVAGRGAGGHCFPKDWAAFRELYERVVSDDEVGLAMLKAVEAKNNELLVSTGKDLDLLAGIYGEEVVHRK